MLVGLALSACGATRPTLGARVPPTTTTTTVPVRFVAEARNGLKSIGVYDAPGAAAPKQQLSNPNSEQVVRPNGSTGWIRAADVNIVPTYYRLRVDLGGHRITVWNGNDVVDDEPVGVGTAAAPTPPGEYYITEALTVPSFQRAAYGPFAFGISGHSNVYTSFGGGDGTIGIHGTADQASVGKDVSHGCIRLSNEGITRLVKEVPLGSPVEIIA